jgi:pimeloyl-ACP methyl ester carboxylesterase
MSGFAGANLSLTDLIGRSVENFQSTIGANGQLYEDVLGTVINGGQIFGWFNDGTSALGASVVPPSELKDRTLQFWEKSQSLIYGENVSALGVDGSGNVIPHDVASLLAGSSQIDGIGQTDQATIRIIRTVDVTGQVSFIVQIPSTQVWDPATGPAPNDLSSSVHALRDGDHTALAQAVYAAMEQAGIGSSPVMLMGFSLGGLTAGAIAAGDAGYNITQVVTAGAPIGRIDIPPGVGVTSLESREDIVPTLDGAPNCSSWTTIREETPRLSNEAPGTVFSPRNSHDANRYATMALNHPNVNADPRIMVFMPAGGKSVITDYYAIRE